MGGGEAQTAEGAHCIRQAGASGKGRPRREGILAGQESGTATPAEMEAQQQDAADGEAMLAGVVETSNRGDGMGQAAGESGIEEGARGKKRKDVPTCETRVPGRRAFVRVLTAPCSSGYRPVRRGTPQPASAQEVLRHHRPLGALHGSQDGLTLPQCGSV